LAATVPGAVAVSGNSAKEVAKKPGETLNDATTVAGEQRVKRPRVGVSKREPSPPQMSSKGVTIEKESGLKRQASSATVSGAVAVPLPRLPGHLLPRPMVAGEEEVATTPLPLPRLPGHLLPRPMVAGEEEVATTPLPRPRLPGHLLSRPMVAGEEEVATTPPPRPHLSGHLLPHPMVAGEEVTEVDNASCYLG
jgi:hypothetical protein